MKQADNIIKIRLSIIELSKSKDGRKNSEKRLIYGLNLNKFQALL